MEKFLVVLLMASGIGTVITACESDSEGDSALVAAADFSRWGQSSPDVASVTEPFGIHSAGYEPSSNFDVSFTPVDGSQVIHFQSNPRIEARHIAFFTYTHDQDGLPAMAIQMSEEGQRLLRSLTSDSIDRPIVFTLNGNVLYTPHVLSPISRNGVITRGADISWMRPLEQVLLDAGAEKVRSLP